MIREVAVVVGVVCSAGVAFADEATARKLFEDGERQYNLGEHDRAVDLFKKAYEQWPEPAFLFNVAQTYRQIGNCKQALFFYKRFLSLKEQDTKKPLRPQLKEEVDKRIVELDECVKRELASKPPTQLESGGTGTPAATGGTGAARPATGTGTGTAVATGADGATTDGDDSTDDGPDDSITETAPQPSMLSVRATGGIGKLTAGDLGTKFQFATSIIGGYPLSLGDALQLEIGAALSFTPVPYTTTMDESGSGSLLGLAANVAPSYAITPKLSLRADVGLGVLVFAGLGKDGNPFTMAGAPATGPLSTLLVRVAISGDYAVTENVVLSLTPLAFSYSPAPSGFAEGISSLTTLSFLAGVGYRR